MNEYLLSKYLNNIAEKNQEITVFIITYNRANYLKLAIESILKQTYTNFTLIILDNFSSDSTEEVVGTFDDDRIIYIKHVSNLETSESNMRYAFELCKTEYLIVFHDDDTVQNTFVERGLEEIKKTNCVALSVGGKIIDKNGMQTGEVFNHHGKKIFKNDEYFAFFFGRFSDSMLYPSVIYRRSFFKDYKEFVTVMDVGPSNDQYMWFQIGRYGGSICMDNLNLMNYRVHSNQDSQINSGFIVYQLIDGLYRIPYYDELIKRHNKDITLRILSSFESICKNYYLKRITIERLRSVKEYECIKKLKKTNIGRLVYMLVSLSCMMPIVGKCLIHIDIFRKKIIGIYNGFLKECSKEE